MAQLEQKPTPFIPGMRELSVRDLNQLLKLPPRQVRGGGDSRVDYYGDRVVVSSKQPTNFTPDVANYIRQFVVLAVFDNVLLCTPQVFTPNVGSASLQAPVFNPLAGVNSLPVVWVAKPYHLQRTPWDGQVVGVNNEEVTLTWTGLDSRTANNGSNSNFQMVAPSYFPGDIIQAVSCQTGYVDTVNGLNVVWSDLNTAGRAWVVQGNLAQNPTQLPYPSIPSTSTTPPGAFVGCRLLANGLIVVGGMTYYTFAAPSGPPAYDTAGFYTPSTPSEVTIVNLGYYAVSFMARWGNNLGLVSDQYSIIVDGIQMAYRDLLSAEKGLDLVGYTEFLLSGSSILTMQQVRGGGSGPANEVYAGSTWMTVRKIG